MGDNNVACDGLSCSNEQDFEYQEDPPKSKIANTTFPSLSTVLAVPWKDLVKRHFPLSDIFVRSRVMSRYRWEQVFFMKKIT